MISSRVVPLPSLLSMRKTTIGADWLATASDFDLREQAQKQVDKFEQAN